MFLLAARVFTTPSVRPGAGRPLRAYPAQVSLTAQQNPSIKTMEQNLLPSNQIPKFPTTAKTKDAVVAFGFCLLLYSGRLPLAIGYGLPISSMPARKLAWESSPLSGLFYWCLPLLAVIPMQVMPHRPHPCRQPPLLQRPHNQQQSLLKRQHRNQLPYLPKSQHQSRPSRLLKRRLRNRLRCQLLNR